MQNTDTFSAISIGLILMMGSFSFLFWNESRAVNRSKTLDEGAAQTISISATTPIDPANDGKLVHLTTEITGGGSSLTDPIFGVSTKDLFLDRQVSMYQWKEEETTKTRTNADGEKETTTTYSYYKGWSVRLQRSSTFHERANHGNPPSFPFEKLRLQHDSIFAGPLELPEEIIKKIDWFSPLSSSSYDWNVTEIVDLEVQDRTKIFHQKKQSGYYVYKDNSEFTTQKSSPSVGDTRITFSSVEPRTISIIAQQQGGSLQRWEAEEYNGSILFFSEGEKSIDQLFASAETRNAATTWTLRLLGSSFMCIGMCFMLAPFADTISTRGGIAAFYTPRASNSTSTPPSPQNGRNDEGGQLEGLDEEAPYPTQQEEEDETWYSVNEEEEEIVFTIEEGAARH